MHVKDIPGNLLTGYQSRLGAIGAQAKGLEKLDNPKVYSAFVESSISDTVESHAPMTEERAYTKMVGAVAKNLTDFPELQKGLWQVALGVVTSGVPGCAGVALAKSLEAAGELAPEDKGWAALQGLYELRLDQGQTLIGEQVHADIGLQAATNQSLSVTDRETIASNTISTIAAMENWNIAIVHQG